MLTGPALSTVRSNRGVALTGPPNSTCTPAAVVTASRRGLRPSALTGRAELRVPPVAVTATSPPSVTAPLYVWATLVVTDGPLRTVVLPSVVSEATLTAA